eukprot:TRINITY_DN23540_c0_g2_i1.p1 TRINITY_DN23540_c0_g2~~TRINITY_DN23540_c0_g2_i1.p1  ORF type:complete len:1185 (-),score=236.22 TRINITY_DN23540_c0_g2_i1:1138-4692(-)
MAEVAPANDETSRGFSTDGDMAQPLLRAQSNRLVTEKLEVDDLRRLLSERRTVSLLLRWARKTIPLYLEILFLVCTMYYIDVALDMRTLHIFWRDNDIQYLIVSVGAIIAANIYSLFDMLRNVPSDDPGAFVMLVGFLTPFFLHIAALTVISLRRGKKHPLLACAKLAEAALEAFVASLVQTYALLYKDLEQAEWAVIGTSILSSFLSIGFALMCFDRQDIGLDGVPGRLVGLDLKMVVVFMARVVEVASRISTIAVFCRVTRHELHVAVLDLPMPFSLLESMVFANGVFLLLCVDFLVFIVAIAISQSNNHALGRTLYAAPSTLCFMNPMLEKGNPCTVPAIFYYTWRLVEILLMGAVSYYMVGVRECHRKLSDDKVVVEFAAGTTLVWALLFPLIRYFLADHVLLTYSEDMMSSKPFNRSQALLRDELLNAEDFVEVAVGSSQMTASAKMLAIARQTLLESTSNLSATLERKERSKKHGKTREAASPQEMSPVGAEAEERDGDAEATIAPVDKSSQWWVYPWAERCVHEHERREARRGSTEEMFTSTLHIGINLIPRVVGPSDKWVSSVGKEKHLDFLKCLHTAMSTNTSVQQVAIEHLTTFLQILPDWRQWSNDDIDLKLQKQKWLIIALLGGRGWESQALSFYSSACDLHRALDIRVQHTDNDPHSAPEMSADNWESCARAQTRVLVNLWRCMPIAQMEKQNYIEEICSLYREDVEWQVMLQGAQFMLQHQSQQHEGHEWHNEELLNFCDVASQAINIDILPDGLSEEVKNIQTVITTSASKEIATLHASFEKHVKDQKLDSKVVNAEFNKLKKLLVDITEKKSKCFAWANDLQSDAKQKLKNATSKITRFIEAEKKRILQEKKDEAARRQEEEKKRKEEEKRRQEEEKKRKEADERRKEAEEQQQELEEELQHAEEVVEAKERQAKRALRAAKLHHKEMRMRLKRAKVRKSNGVVIQVSVQEGIEAFTEYLCGDDDEEFGERFEIALSNWLEVPKEGVSVEQDIVVNGAMIRSIEVENFAKSPALWTKLDEYKKGTKVLKASKDGLKLTVIEVQAGTSFTLKCEGNVGVLFDSDKVVDMMDDLEQQLGLPLEALGSSTSKDITGQMSVRALVSLSKLIKDQVNGELDVEPFSVAGLSCDLTVEEEEDDGLDDDASIAGLPRGLTGISEASESSYDSSDF